MYPPSPMSRGPSENEGQNELMYMEDAAAALDNDSSKSEYNKELTRRILRKVDMRLLPMAFVVYMLCILDRANIGAANNYEYGLSRVFGMTSLQFNITLMLFYIPEIILDPLSNYCLQRTSPAFWIGILCTSWGVIATLNSVASDFSTFAGLRFLLGFFEAGLLPGIVFSMTYWYRSPERGVRIAIIMAASSLANAFGGAIAFAVGHLEGHRGKHAFYYLFIFEGLPSVVMGFLTMIFYPSSPRNASFLTPEEREWANTRLGSHRAVVGERPTWAECRETLLEPRLWFQYGAFLGGGCAFASLSLFAPAIVKGLGYSPLKSQLMSVPPYAIAFVVVCLSAYVADRRNTRAWFAAAANIIASFLFLAMAIVSPHAFKARYVLLCAATTASFVSVPPLLSWVGSNLRGSTAPMLAISLNVGLGNIGQLIGAWAYQPKQAPGYSTGHYVNFGMAMFAAICTLIARYLLIYGSRKQKASTVASGSRMSVPEPSTARKAAVAHSSEKNRHEVEDSYLVL